MTTTPATATDLFAQFTGAVVEGGKAGLAAELAREITETLVSFSGFTLPAFLSTGIGKRALPIVVCYAIALASVLIPGFPQAERVRYYALLGAKGSATIFVADTEIAGKLKNMARMIVGIGTDFHEKGLPEAASTAVTEAIGTKA